MKSEMKDAVLPDGQDSCLHEPFIATLMLHPSPMRGDTHRGFLTTDTNQGEGRVKQAKEKEIRYN